MFTDMFKSPNSPVMVDRYLLLEILKLSMLKYLGYQLADANPKAVWIEVSPVFAIEK